MNARARLCAIARKAAEKRGPEPVSIRVVWADEDPADPAVIRVTWPDASQELAEDLEET